MTFLAPWAAWFLAGIPIIVLLYLLKLKRRPLTVSTLMFWERLLQESRRRALFQRLRNLLSLLLHLLIFLLIVAALAKPAFDRFVRAGSSTVLILDSRARMQALEPGGDSRFELAKRLAGSYTRQAGGDQHFALLTQVAAPAVVAPFTDDEKALRESLSNAAVTDAGGDLAEAIRLAQDLLASRKGARRVVVLTDHAPQQPEPGVEYVAVGSSRENVAITRLATRPLLNSPETSEILIELRNFGDATTTGNVELAYDGRLLDVKPFTLEAGGRRLEVFPSVPRASRSTRGWLTARLDTADALPLDNIAYAVLPPPRPKRVLLITSGNWFVEKMLDADRTLSFELLTPENFRADLVEKFDAVVLDNFLPPDLTLAGLRGNILFLKRTPFSADEIIEQPLVSDIDAAHPALRLVNLQNVTIVRAAAATVPQETGGWLLQAPLKAIDQPLMITGERRTKTGRQRLAALTFDVAESDLPLRVAFPLLMSNTVQWLAGDAADAMVEAKAGETLQLAPEQTLHPEPQTDPAATPPESMAQRATGFFQPLRNGFYQVQDAQGTSWLAVNTFDSAESDLRSSAAAPAPAASPLPMLSAATFGGWPLWQYLALAALLLFAFEWHLFHRRRTE